MQIADDTNTMKKTSFLAFAAAAFALPAFFGGFPTMAQQGFFPFATTASGNTAPNAPVSANTSLNWSGYVATGGTFTGVTGSWNIPESSAPTNDPSGLSADATWVGIGGVSGQNDLIQAGTQTVFQNGSPTYEAWYELLPNTSEEVPLTVSPGDAMNVSLSQAGSGQWNISITDATTGKSYNTTVSYNSSLSSAEWIEEMPTATHGRVALDNFGTASFTNGATTENGSQVMIAGANAQPLTMIENSGQALATPSSIGGSGNSFTVTRTDTTSAPSSSFTTMPTYPTSGFGGSGYGGGGYGQQGRWYRTGTGVQGYTPRTRPSTTTYTTTGTGGSTQTQTGAGWQWFRSGNGNLSIIVGFFGNNGGLRSLIQSELHGRASQR